MITQSELKKILDYNPETGTLIWKVKSAYNTKVGYAAGYLNKSNGYIIIMIDGMNYRAHRLAWFITYCAWPKREIDHINHERADNRIVNLREVSRQENNKNMSKAKNNKSGVTGVHWDKARDRWTAKIQMEGKAIYLGRFIDKFEAICARKSANNKYGFHENHGTA